MKNKITVAIDSGPLKSGHSFRGIGAHTREMIKHLESLNSNTLGVDLDVFDFSAHLKKIYSGKYDVVHFTSFHPYFISIPFKKPDAKVVLTIHDLIPLIYPNHYKAGIKGKIRFLINKILIKKSVDQIVTISETSKKDICRFIGISPQKVSVVYLAAREIFEEKASKTEITKVIDKYSLPKKFALYVGDINYNKNIPALINACSVANIPLVIVGKQALELENIGMDLRTLNGPMDYYRYLFGKPHPELAHYKELYGSFTKNKNVIRLGYVSDSDLAMIYKLASVYCQPSKYEGFGLPILEAFASGTPVIANKIQALVEIGGRGAVYVNIKDANEFTEAVKKYSVGSENSKKLVNTAASELKEYSWNKMAKETFDLYKNIVNE